jgi:hypothetical protein
MPKPVLFFKQENNLLVISGKSFYVKDHLKELKIGARFNPIMKTWTIPMDFDTEGLRHHLEQYAKEKIANEKEEKQKQLEYSQTPEGKAELKEARKAQMRAYLQEDKERIARGEQRMYLWVCCEDCELISCNRGKYHTCCWTCADWNGMWWEPFMINGMRRTGD